jgi:putative phage-type endonuclease
MTAYTTIPMPEVGSEEWHRLRRESGIGASETPALFGDTEICKFNGPADIYALKRGLIEPQESNRAMRAGNALEPFICSEFQLETGIKGSKPDFMAKSIKYPWMFANLDFMADGGKEMGEFKRSNAPHLWGPSGSDQYPQGYYIQCQHALLVTEITVCHLAVLLPYDELRVYHIQPNQTVQEGIADLTETFWNNVQNGIMPEEGSMSRETINALFNQFLAPVEINDPAVLQMLQRHKQLSRRVELLTAKMDEIKNRLMIRMGNAKKATVTGWTGTMTRSEIKGSEYTVVKKPHTQFRINHSRKED